MKLSKNNAGQARVYVVDGMNPEDVAMLQALYSRSAESVETHLAKVETMGSQKFFDNFVVGYGHKSIADCGSTTLFFENVSLLAAKAVQDWPLYSGQETSTRYIDMSKQTIVDPINNDDSHAILERWMSFYTSNQEECMISVRSRFPQKEGEPTSIYERALKARVFDIMRGFLPAGIRTQLSWSTNLRQAADHLIGLCHHPLEEISSLGEMARQLLAEQYTASGFGSSQASVSGVGKSGGDEAERARDEWEAKVAGTCSYHATEPGRYAFKVDFQKDILWPYEEILRTRPRGSVLPHFLMDLGLLTFGFSLDFGSFRDIQRHRNGVCRMPLLNTELGFEPWYISELGPSLADKAKELVAKQTRAIKSLTNDAIVAQYYCALGYKVPCRVSYGLPAAVYVMELRSGKTVHPTLRTVTHGMIAQFKKVFPNVTLHVDIDPSDWDVRRGGQTISHVSER